MPANEIVWRPSTVHEHGEDACVGNVAVGAVFRLEYSDNWYGYIAKDCRVGSCGSLERAKHAVEEVWHYTPNNMEMIDAVDKV